MDQIRRITLPLGIVSRCYTMLMIIIDAYNAHGVVLRWWNFHLTIFFIIQLTNDSSMRIFWSACCVSIPFNCIRDGRRITWQWKCKDKKSMTPKKNVANHWCGKWLFSEWWPSRQMPYIINWSFALCKNWLCWQLIKFPIVMFDVCCVTEPN